jgi:hypothetical protein
VTAPAAAPTCSASRNSSAPGRTLATAEDDGDQLDSSWDIAAERGEWN